MKPRRHAALLFALLACTGYSHAQVWGESCAPQAEKPLIAYVSRSGNTEALARIIARHTGGTLARIETLEPYPADYSSHVRAVQQQNDSGELPAIRAVQGTQARIWFIGFPTWGMRLPPPLKTLLRQSDLQGKTLIPFNTYGQYGVGSGFAELETICQTQGCTVRQGLSIAGGRERDGIIFVMRGEKAQSAEKAVRQWLCAKDGADAP